MVQPFDYSLGIASPQESFLAGLQMAQRQQQIRTERDQVAAQTAAEQAKIDRANQYALRAREVAKDPSPEKLSDLYAEFREYGADIDRFAKSLSESDKRTYGSILQKAIIARGSGRTDQEISEIYASGAQSARNSNRLDIAERFDAAAQMALNPKMNDDFAARSLLRQFDPDAYKEAYEYTDTTTVPGVGVVLNSQIRQAAAEARARGSQDIDIPVLIPADAIADLKAGRVTPAAFEKVFGSGSANKALKEGGQTEKPSGTFQGQ